MHGTWKKRDIRASVCAHVFVCHKLVHGEIASSACRGIDVVRNKIKMFAQKKVTLPPGRHKIVILDEADRYDTDVPMELLCKYMPLMSRVLVSLSFARTD